MRGNNKGGGGDVYFTYDATGQRVRKVWVHSGLVEERIYLGAIEIYRRHASSITGTIEVERETLHVTDTGRRVAMVETKTIDTLGGTGTGVSRWRYQLDNHLGSALLELDEAGAVISYEEYHPFGSTAFHTARGGAEVSAKRYRYTGKEKDDETGLYYHGARYYAPWLGRWTAVDPAGLVDGLNVYRYSRDNPVRYSDPSGTQSEEEGGFFSGVGNAFESFRAGLQETGEGFGDFVFGVVHDDNEKIISGGEKVIGFLEGFTIEGQVSGLGEAAEGAGFQTARAIDKALEGDFEAAGDATTRALGNAAVVALVVVPLAKGLKATPKAPAAVFEPVAPKVTTVPKAPAPKGTTFAKPKVETPKPKAPASKPKAETPAAEAKAEAPKASVEEASAVRDSTSRAGNAESATAARAGVESLDPATVRFSQSSIKPEFKDPKFDTIDDLAGGLRTGRIDPADVKPIRIVEREGKLISIDNRRLEAFRRAGVPVRTRRATEAEIKQAERQGKFSAGPLGSDTIRIRGQRRR